MIPAILNYFINLFMTFRRSVGSILYYSIVILLFWTKCCRRK